MATPTWEQTCERARSLGWQYGPIRRSNISEWWKYVDGKFHYNGSDLWRKEVEGPLWNG